MVFLFCQKKIQRANLNSIFFPLLQSDCGRSTYNRQDHIHVSAIVCQEVHAHSISRVSHTLCCPPVLLSRELCISIGRSACCLFLYDVVNIHPPRTGWRILFFNSKVFNFIFNTRKEKADIISHYYFWNNNRLIFLLSSPGEAVGHLLCVLKQSSLQLPVRAQADKTVRSLWAQPPVGGAHVVATVLSNPAHLVEW